LCQYNNAVTIKKTTKVKILSCLSGASNLLYSLRPALHKDFRAWWHYSNYSTSNNRIII